MLSGIRNLQPLHVLCPQWRLLGLGILRRAQHWDLHRLHLRRCYMSGWGKSSYNFFKKCKLKTEHRFALLLVCASGFKLERLRTLNQRKTASENAMKTQIAIGIPMTKTGEILTNACNVICIGISISHENHLQAILLSHFNLFWDWVLWGWQLFLWRKDMWTNHWWGIIFHKI